MTDVLAHVVSWLNIPANALGRFVLFPISLLPGWLSVTVVAAVSGVLLLLVFKVTSNQRAIKRVRDDINANLLALRLFKDNTSLAFRVQGPVLLGALRLSLLAVVPMLVMLVPVTLLISQLGLWYECRPLRVGEEAVVTMTLNGDAAAPWPKVNLEPADAAETTVRPVRVQSRREVCWNLKAREAGYHRLVFRVDGKAATKELAVGDGLMRVSTRRPGWDWWDALEHPGEPPFGPDCTIRSIDIDYPPRTSWTSGAGWWLAYWFVVSMVAALCFRRALNVQF
jgi:hypothetical protein